MDWLYRPAVNTALRTLFRPFARWMPEATQFPITAPFQLRLDADRSLTIIANPTSYVAKRLFWGGMAAYEPHQTSVFLHLLGDARVVFDVGANIGLYSLLAAAYRPTAQVYAFDPLPAAFHYLRLNLDANGASHVVAEQVALSDATGTATFHEARNRKFAHWPHHLTGASSFDQPDNHYLVSTAYDVATETLDDYAARHALPALDLLKIDAEASEHRILRGGATTIARFQPVVLCEVIDARVEAAMEAFFLDAQYTLFNARPDGLYRVPGLVGQNRQSHDFVMVPPGQEARVRALIRT